MTWVLLLPSNSHPTGTTTSPLGAPGLAAPALSFREKLWDGENTLFLVKETE